MGSMLARVLLVLAGCGRVAFDTRSDAAPDAAPDAFVPTCMGEPIDAMFLGHRSTCFLGNAGSRWCVGEFAGLGFANGTGPLVPTSIAGDDGWTLLGMGWGTNLGVQNGALMQWDENPPTVNDPNGSSIVAIDAETYESCTRDAAGAVNCSGGAVPGTWI